MTREPFALWGITVDCIEVAAAAEFWSQLFGVEARTDSDLPGWLRVGPTAPGGPHLSFQPVREGKSSKTRIHLDLLVADLDEAARLVRELGGSGPSESHRYPTGAVLVMADPEGNEFCLVASTTADVPNRG